MPTFSSFREGFYAKGAVVIDGEIYTTSATDGFSVPVIPSSYSAFLGVPKRSAVGVWSVTMRDPAFRVIDCHVTPLTVAAGAVGVVMQPPTNNSTGQLVLHWTFTTIGTDTAADIGVSKEFQVTVIYSETSVA